MPNAESQSVRPSSFGIWHLPFAISCAFFSGDRAMGIRHERRQRSSAEPVTARKSLRRIVILAVVVIASAIPRTPVSALSWTGIMTTAAGHCDRIGANPCQGFSGDGGPANQAKLSTPVDVAVDGNGNLYIADVG